MSNTTLHNENVSVTLKSLGAELTSIKDASGTEYLWQGNPEFWSGQAPVLFPIVGCLRNGTATIGDNKTCSFGRHGLARRLEFDLVSSSDTSITYSLKANDTYKFREDAIYNMALSYQKLGDDDNAIKYYKKFVNTYKASSNFYDDSYYHLGMLYYKNDRLQDAKNAFYDLRGSDPNSPYNNSEKVKEILRK